MRTLVKHYCLLLVLDVASISVIAQAPDYAFAKEKIYIHTNHVFFKPGESLYFKLYLVKAQDQTPSRESGVAYVEILNPSGNVIQKMNYKVTDGYTEGSFEFNEQLPGGIYKIRAYTTWMQNEKDNTFFVKELTLQKLIAPRVLIKLDFPAKGYGPGDEVLADYSIRNLSDQPIKNYEARFTVSIAGKIILTNTFRTNNEGKAKVKFRLPDDLASNDGLLNITIAYDSYTEAISRSIPIVLHKIDLQFMPEGGTLVENISTNIAFKALNENGKAADIKGEVWDNEGNKVTAFESYHFGMGKFAFTPRPGRTYTARITSPVNIPQKFKLPVAVSDGVVMNISKKDSIISVRIAANRDRELNLIGQTKNVIYYSKSISLQKGSQTIQVNEKLFPAGIAQFTLYTDDDLPLAERLCFLNENKTLRVSITTNKNKYLPREKVTMTLQTLNETGKPVPANFSLAVVDDKLWTLADDKQDHIFSWLLMSSELKGKIEEPQFYFKKDEPKAIPALDLVMLTNGYRYFDYIDYVQKEGRLKFTPDQDNILSGVVINKKEKPVKANVFLVDPNARGKALYIKTNEDGVFFFSDLAPLKNYYLIAQSLQRKEKVTIRVLQNGRGYNPLKASQLTPLASIYKTFNGVRPAVAAVKKAEEVNIKIALDDKEMKLPANVNLQEVVVVGYATQRRKDVTGAVARIDADEIMPVNNVMAKLEGRVAGLMIVPQANPGAAQDIRIRGAATLGGANRPLLVINGVPAEKFDLNLNAADVESVEVLKDAAATTIYGSRAANGVIVVTSKKYRNEKLRIGLAKEYYYTTQPVQAGGTVYAVAKKFYAPEYYSLVTEERNDFRETIYWNPVVQTDKDGKAVVEFYNSDASTTFRAIAEGIGYNGKIGRAEATYAVQNAMTVDAKIPPYLTVGDKALIPLIIKNNTAKDLDASLSLYLPANMKSGSYSKIVSLAPDSSKQILIPVEAVYATKGVIRFIVKNSFSTETISLPVTAADKGFPVTETVSGNHSSDHQLIISKMIPGTLKTELKLYRSIEGQLLDGIESMLREPYGCFEQTSSTTYPNIFVLKYLRESGKSNPDIEKKARGYIEEGYKRLISFETQENGFEWFGHTPAHEALTAYGLLEFTDIQEFVNVDRGMLERTKKFLMDRRDGKGSFKLASGGYDRFASVPNKIANIYIVYALTRAGIGKEIQPEYTMAVSKAMESNDAYQLAMMALAADNMKNEKDYSKLMTLLNENYKKFNLKCETSVVNSRDASLRVESMSLYAMALMREKTPDIGLIAGIISRILGEKNYYGYGSTQSTVLALQAIVEYSKLTGKIAADSEVTFVLNQKTVTPGNGLTTVMQDGENSFGIHYSNDKTTIPYNLEYSYNTLTPPNSPNAELKLGVQLDNATTHAGETVRMTIEVKNEKANLQPMAIAKIGIPAGLSAQPWQLKEIMEKNQAAYYEIFDNYLVFYWMGFASNETKTIHLDLKAEIPGTYKAKASNVYLYYTPEHKHWADGAEVEVMP